MPNEAETGEEEDVIVSHCGSSRGTGSFGILYRFLINVIEWGVPEHSLITFSTLILRRKQQIDLFEGSWETRGTKVHVGDPESVPRAAAFRGFSYLSICSKVFLWAPEGRCLSDTHTSRCNCDKAHYKLQGDGVGGGVLGEGTLEKEGRKMTNR